MNFSDFSKFMDQYFMTKRAQVANAIQTNRDQIYTFTIDLGTEVLYNQTKYRIDKPFKAISFEDGTDQNAYVFVQFDAQSEGKSFKKFKQNAGLNCETMFNGATIYFPAQSGKTISCTIYYDSTYNSGALINSGTVSITNPSVFPLGYSPVVAAATPKLMFAANTSAFYREFQNNDVNDVWIGPVTVSNADPTLGLKIPPGGYYKTTSTAAIYVYSVAGYAVGTGLTGWENT